MLSLEERQQEMRARMRSRKVRAKWSQPAIARARARAIAPIGPQSGVVDKGFSQRQIQLLQLLADGQNLKRAAAELKIGHQTARNYASVLRKVMGAKTIAQAVILGIRKGIIQ